MPDDPLKQDIVGAGRSDRLNIDDLPQPRIANSRWPQIFTWLVPLLALGGTMYYAYHISREYGKEIDVIIDDANAVEPDKTLVRCHGVQIGKVVGVTLADGQHAAKVRLRLRRDSEQFARQGARFWLVQPEFNNGGIVGFNTILRGPYFEAIAGDGAIVKDLTALPRPPATSGDGFHIQLQADTRAHLSPGTPVLYRGFDVGAVASSSLSGNAQHIVAVLNIDPRYAKLIRRNSIFWVQAPAEIKGGLIGGVEVKLGSLKSLFGGGIAFATPDKPLAEPAFENGAFELTADMPKEAEQWHPDIPIEPLLDEGRQFPGGEPAAMASEAKSTPR